MRDVGDSGDKMPANSRFSDSADQHRTRPRRGLAIAFVTAVSIGLSGCSTLPDWANPVDWYDTAFGNDAAPPPKAFPKAEKPEPAPMPQTAAVEEDDDSILPDWANPTKWFEDDGEEEMAAAPEAKPEPPQRATMADDEDSILPDWANPLKWFEDDETEMASSKSDSGSFPSLSSVPADAPKTQAEADRRAVAAGLAADKSAAKYTDETLRAGGTPSTQVAATQPRPNPVVKPVAQPVQQPRPAASQPVTPQPVASKPRMPKLASASDPAAPRPVQPGSVVAAPQPVAAASAPPPAPLPPLVAPAPAQTAAAAPPPPAPLPPLTPPGAIQPTPVQPAAPRLVQGVAPRQVAALNFPNAGQNELARIFAASLAQSASTVTTAPANSTFAAPVASPLTSVQSNVASNVLEAYNDPLTGKTPASSTVTPGVSLASETPKHEKVVVHFGNGSSRLNRKDKASIRKAAKAYAAGGRGVIRVVGHASHRTRDMNVARHRMINFNVSLDRANAVARELMRHGVDASVLRIEARSDAEPIYYEYMPEGEAENRRTEIFLEF